MVALVVAYFVACSSWVFAGARHKFGWDVMILGWAILTMVYMMAVNS